MIDTWRTIAATLMDKAVKLTYIGGQYAGQHPTEFLCLTLKMLQLQPEKEIVHELIKQEDFKYVLEKRDILWGAFTDGEDLDIYEHWVRSIYDWWVDPKKYTWLWSHY